MRYSLEIGKAFNGQWHRWRVACFEFWAVNANWNEYYRYWDVYANSVDNPNPWNAGNQILSC